MEKALSRLVALAKLPLNVQSFRVQYAAPPPRIVEKALMLSWTVTLTELPVSVQLLRAPPYAPAP